MDQREDTSIGMGGIQGAGMPTAILQEYAAARPAVCPLNPAGFPTPQRARGPAAAGPYLFSFASSLIYAHASLT